MAMMVIEELGRLLEARANCIRVGNEEWRERHEKKIKELVEAYFPSGSGFDIGCEIDLDKSNNQKLVIYTSYHRMRDGYYTGWVDFKVIAYAIFGGFRLKVIGGTEDEKEYVAQVFYDALMQEVEEIPGEP